jgi:hypothetical protein
LQGTHLNPLCIPNVSLNLLASEEAGVSHGPIFPYGEIFGAPVYQALPPEQIAMRLTRRLTAPSQAYRLAVGF